MKIRVYWPNSAFFDENPKFNPKEDDNFKVVRAALDLIQSEKLSANISKSCGFFKFL